MPSSSGISFTPHVIVVSVGEVCLLPLVSIFQHYSSSFMFLEMVFFFVVSQDIASKVLSFSQQGPRAICVLSVIGAVSTATLIQPAPSHGAITYEVCYYYSYY